MPRDVAASVDVDHRCAGEVWHCRGISGECFHCESVDVVIDVSHSRCCRVQECQGLVSLALLREPDGADLSPDDPAEGAWTAECAGVVVIGDGHVEFGHAKTRHVEPQLHAALLDR